MDEGLTEQEVAQRAGVSPELVARAIELGILSAGLDGTFTRGDVQRARVIDAVAASGIPVDSIARAVADGHVSFAFADLVLTNLPALADLTYAEVCAREGVPLDLLARSFEAVALPRPRPDDPAPPDIGEILAVARWAIDSGIGEEEFVRSARIYGESMYRIAQAEPARWHEYVEMPLLRSGMSERQMQEIAFQSSPLVRQMVERMILWVYRRHQAHFSIDHMVQHVEAAAEEQGLVVGRPERNPAIAFLDLTGYTRLTEETGDEAAADLAARLADLVHDLAAPNGGRAVKFLGDGVMFHFAEPAGAVVAVLEMVDRTSRVGLPPAHVGVSTGPLVTRDGDYFGRTVNVASRIAAYAGPGQVLVSAEVAATARAEGVTFDPIGEVSLKGLLKAVDLHRAAWAGTG